MSTMDSISEAMDAVATKKESLHNAYLELESHSFAPVKIRWKELEGHFDLLEELMRKRAAKLGVKLEEKSNIKPSKPSETPLPEIKSLCDKIDAVEMNKFIRRISRVGGDPLAALRSAPRPAELVLKVLEGFYTNDKGGKPDKDVSFFFQRRRAGILLLESLPAVVEENEIAADVKQAAKELADEWKGKIDMEGGNWSYHEANAFLHLLAAYGIGGEGVDADDLLAECVVAVCRRKQIPDICRKLGMTDKMPDIIKKLINNGKQIESLNFVHAFGLVEKFPPVPLLTEYLKGAKKVSQEIVNNGKNSFPAQNDAATKEISAVKAVIKCIKEHNLESQMDLEKLEKRVTQLDKAKADRKRSAQARKSRQTKRPRVHSSGASAPTANRTPTTYPSSTVVDRGFLSPADRLNYPAPVTDLTAYNMPSGQFAYDSSSQGILGSSYGVGSRSDMLSRSQLFPSDSVPSSLYGVGSFVGASSNYSSYTHGTGLPPSASSYPSLYLC